MVLCIQDRTFVWLIQRHYNLCVQMEEEQNHSHAKEFEHHHVQLPEYLKPLIYFWNPSCSVERYRLECWNIFFSIFLGFAAHMLNKIMNKATYAQL